MLLILLPLLLLQVVLKKDAEHVNVTYEKQHSKARDLGCCLKHAQCALRNGVGVWLVIASVVRLIAGYGVPKRHSHER